MKTLCGIACMFFCCTVALADSPRAELSEHLGETPALVVVVCSESESDLTAIVELVEKTPWTIVCRGMAGADLSSLRKWAQSKGMLGHRVSVIDGDGTSLWLADNMADAVWISPRVDNPPSQGEILRVLHPGGVYIATGIRKVKPRQDSTDEWRHPYHGPDNNVVSQDGVAKLPGELRFQTYPVFAAMPNQTLFAGGRIFFFSGHIAFHQREEPLLNQLTVLNAYNGLPLWNRPLDPNFVVHNISKMATDSEVVFAEGPTLRMLDAATGKERGAFHVPPDAAEAGDTDWKWIAQENGMLWAAFGPPDARVAPHSPRRQMGHWPWNVANDRYQSIIDNFGNARRLAAFKYPEMTLLWCVSEPEPFDARALCMDDGRIFELAPTKYVAARDSIPINGLGPRSSSVTRDVSSSKPLTDRSL